MNKVEKYKELIQTAAALISRRVTSTDMDFQQWKSSVDRMLAKEFGTNSREHELFRKRRFCTPVVGANDDRPQEPACVRDIELTQKELQDYLNELLSEEENVNAIQVQAKEYDVFLSHAANDKISYVNELYDVIRTLGITVFYDSTAITWGDKWKEKIIEGLHSSEFAIIVLSEQFFDREWTERELHELLEQQNENKQKLVLPLLYGITIEQLTKKYPQLGEIQCISAMTYSKEKIAILLAKELIKRYKAIGGKMKLPARARTPKQNSPNLHHNVFLLCYNTPLHSPADTNYFMRQSGASS